MQPVESVLADLRRRIVGLSRGELMTLVEGVLADWRAAQANVEREMREEIQLLLAHEAEQRDTAAGVRTRRAS